MANRTGIELLPDVCRVVEVQAAGGWFRRGGSKSGATRVKAFHEIPYSPDHPGSCASELRRLLGSRASGIRMAIWGLRSSHQVLYLPQADPQALEAVARREAKAAGGAGAGAGAHADGVMPGEHRDGGRREVGYVSVPVADIQNRLQPFENAGIGIASVVSPAVAHVVLARQRWAQFGETVTAVISVNAFATAITVVRGGVVLFAREMPWGHQIERADRSFGFDAAAFASQLASELRRSLVFLKQQSKVDVGHVLLCGDVPDLRSLTGPLMHELSMEVETLDSLEGFDVAHLPEPADEFRTRIGALRTAWALAVDASPSVNLQPREASTVRFTPALDSQGQRRLATAAIVGVVLAAAVWGGAAWLASGGRAQLDALRRQVSALGPEVQRLDANRQAVALVAAQSAALEAFATQAPRLAKVLESLAKGAPGDVVVTRLTAVPGIGSWKITVSGQAIAGTPALSQAVFNQFLRGASRSAVLGQPVRPPAIAVLDSLPDPIVNAADGVTGSGGAALATGRLEPLEQPRNVVVLDGWTGVGAQGRRYAELTGRRPLRVAPEPHWRFHPGGVPQDVLDGIAQYNAAQAKAERAQVTASGPAIELPETRRPGSVLDFTIEFEVRK